MLMADALFMTDKAMIAMSWALKGNHLLVYPIITDEMYTAKINLRGSATVKNKAFQYVKLCVEINNAKHIGTQLYKQDDSMSLKIDEIYIHYYNKAHGK